jgi:hypothetical protein
MNFFIMV